MAVDASSFIYQEIKKTKKKLDQAMARGDSEAAARLALRISELYKELARARKWGKKSALEMAEEYRRLYERLASGEPLPRAPRGSRGPGETLRPGSLTPSSTLRRRS